MSASTTANSTPARPKVAVSTAADSTAAKWALGRAVALVCCLVAAYLAVIVSLSRVWESDPQYSHGYLVPLFAVGLLWLRRDKLQLQRLRPSWWGIPLIGLALLLRHASAYLFIEYFEQLSLVACLPGLIVAVGGWEALRWSWPAAAYLLYMIPLPYTLEVALREPLRSVGTILSTYTMQTMGLPAVAEGKVIAVGDVRIGVVEACSGLRMMMIFFALSTAVAILSHRPLWQRVLIVASAIPIALIANVARIVSTGTLYALHYNRFADLVFHDLAGWLMMPLALGLLWLETEFLSRLIIEERIQPYAAPLGMGEPRQATPKREPVASAGVP